MTNDEKSWARLDERTITMERRIARLEVAVIAVMVGSTILIANLVLAGAGVVK